VDDLPDIVPGPLQAYRDKVADLAKGGRVLTAQQLVHVRELIDELVGPIPVDANRVVRLNLRRNLW